MRERLTATRRIGVHLLPVRLMGPLSRVCTFFGKTFTLFAVAASFKSRDIFSHDSSLVEVQLANENEANR